MAGLLWPIVGHAITQRFAGTNAFEPAGFLSSDGGGGRRARRAPFAGAVARAHLHGAVDIGCPVGTAVLAPEAGEVVAAGTYASTGERYLMLQIRRGTIVFFTHLSRFTASVGQHVARGEEVARTGNTGMSTGPHLHWEVRSTSKPNPDPRRSGRWFKWNPERLRVGGDMATMGFIQPLAAAAPGVATSAASDGTATITAAAAGPAADAADPPAPDDATDDPAADTDDEVGDEAALHDVVPFVDRTGTPGSF